MPKGVQPDGFANGIRSEKYVNLFRLSLATAYR
jgi:hypothetical protein